MMIFMVLIGLYLSGLNPYLSSQSIINYKANSHSPCRSVLNANNSSPRLCIVQLFPVSNSGRNITFLSSHQSLKIGYRKYMFREVTVKVIGFSSHTSHVIISPYASCAPLGIVGGPNYMAISPWCWHIEKTSANKRSSLRYNLSGELATTAEGHSPPLLFRYPKMWCRAGLRSLLKTVYKRKRKNKIRWSNLPRVASFV